jgi:hypothetical protein
MAGRIALVPRGVVGLQIIFLLIGLGAAAWPVPARTLPFWGTVDSFSKQKPDRISVLLVDSESPASKAGFESGDEVLSIDGKPVDSLKSWEQMVEQLRRGQEAKVKLTRRGRDVELTVKGAEQTVQGNMYFYWQLAYAGVAFVFLLLLMATGSMPPKLVLWRPISLICVGLIAISALLLINSRGKLTLFESQGHIDPQSSAAIQMTVCIAVAVVLIVLAAWEIRATVTAPQEYEKSLSQSPIQWPAQPEQAPPQS